MPIVIRYQSLGIARSHDSSRCYDQFCYRLGGDIKISVVYVICFKCYIILIKNICYVLSEKQKISEDWLFFVKNFAVYSKRQEIFTKYLNLKGTLT